MATLEKPNQFKVVGTSPLRHDGVDKVTGRATYGADIRLPGMLYGAVLRSPHAHAKILLKCIVQVIQFGPHFQKEGTQKRDNSDGEYQCASH